MKKTNKILFYTLFCFAITAPVTAFAKHVSSSSIATQLVHQYENTAANCGSEHMPAFLCSGILIRGTVASVKYASWAASPESLKSGGVSFAYLRKDARFSKMPLEYNNGYILYPAMSAPIDRYKIKVVCAFPVNGQSNKRNYQGCGEHSLFPAISRPCQQQNINDAKQWKRHFISFPYALQSHQCGFLVAKSIKNNAQIFREFIKSHNLIDSSLFYMNNELRVEAWPANKADTLPIQAFFYTTDGIQAAQYDQKVFYRTTGKIVPIVKIVLPTQPKEDVKFIYSNKDQLEKF